MPARTYDPFEGLLPSEAWDLKKKKTALGEEYRQADEERGLKAYSRRSVLGQEEGPAPTGMESMEEYLRQFLTPESRAERRAIGEAGIDVQAGDALRQLSTSQASRGVAGRGAGAAQAQIMSGAIQAKAQLEAQGLQEASQVFGMVMQVEDFKLRELGVDLETRAYMLNATNEALAKVMEAGKDSKAFYQNYSAIMDKYNAEYAAAAREGDFARMAQIVQEASNAIIGTMGEGGGGGESPLEGWAEDAEGAVGKVAGAVSGFVEGAAEKGKGVGETVLGLFSL